MRTVTVEVTQADIEKGCKKDANNCPIARAVLRCEKSITGVQVADSITGWRYDGEEVFRVDTPKAAYDFIDNFDNRRPVAPFTFTLEVPN